MGSQSCMGYQVSTSIQGMYTLSLLKQCPVWVQVWRRAQGTRAAEGGCVRAHRAAPGRCEEGAPGGQPGLLPHFGAAASVPPP